MPKGKGLAILIADKGKKPESDDEMSGSEMFMPMAEAMMEAFENKDVDTLASILEDVSMMNS